MSSHSDALPRGEEPARPGSEPGLPDGLRAAAAHGAKWTAGSGGITAVAQAIQLIVLAQFLDPRDLGLAAIVTVVIGFANAFADMGFTNAIIAKQARGPGLSSLYWLNVIAGFVVAACVLAAGPLIVDIYDEPGLADLIPIAALAFIAVPLGQQFQALLQRDLNFRPLAIAEATAAVAGTIVAIVLAATGTGAAALVWGLVVTTVVRALLLAARGWRSWRPQRRFRRNDLRGFVGFGAFQMGERSINYLASNVDYLLIGYFLGPQTLGAYALAYQLVVRPQILINPILTRVAFPVFTRRQTDDAALRRGYLELIRLLAFVSLPALVALAILAPDVLPAVFGDEWNAAIPLVQILALLGAVKALGNPVGSLYLAKLRPDLGFYVNVAALFLIVAAISAGAQAGIELASWTHVAAVGLLFVVNQRIVYNLIGLGARAYLAALRGPMAAAVAIAVAAAVTVLLARASGVTELGQALIEIAGCLAIAAILLATIGRGEVRSLRRLLSSRDSPGRVLQS